MIDIHTETLLSLSEARRHPVFHTRGRPASLQKMYRLALYGARDQCRRLVRLETVRLPGGLHTSREAIERFIHRLTDPTSNTPTPLPRVRQDQIHCAEQELVEAGFAVGGPA